MTTARPEQHDRMLSASGNLEHWARPRPSALRLGRFLNGKRAF
ncbi:hypothetical protein [Actinomadura sp. NBRC 104425]|nr:hypothetical protein [Actinomadura sp. NBRC 104425]